MLDGEPGAGLSQKPTADRALVNTRDTTHANEPLQHGLTNTYAGKIANYTA
jgi:hypothetical protein